jgi:hypothetical protein
LLREFVEHIRIAIRESPVKCDILPFGVAKLAQRRHERIESCQTCVGFVASAKRQDAYPGVFACWAYAASGQLANALPKSVVNSRRFIVALNIEL